MEMVGHGFNILLSAADAIKLFGPHLCIYHLASLTNKNRCNRLVCYSMVPPPGDDSPIPSFITTSLISLLLQMSTPVPINIRHHLQCILVLTFAISSSKSGRHTHLMDR